MVEWITTENVSVEAWRRILEYANLDFCVSAISAIHGSPKDKSLNHNYKKQAQQIRVSILQSKEYFDAASSSSLFTSPNHLYYGMVSLASAIMLLLGTGEKSLDRLRQISTNRSHGLNFSTSVSDAICRDGLRILENSFVEVLQKGFFLNWYETLPSINNIYSSVEVRKEGVSVRNRRNQGYEILLNSKQISTKKYSVLNLFARLPDVYYDLGRYGYVVAASRSNFETTIDQTNNIDKLTWRIHDAPSPAALEAILEKFKSPLDCIAAWNCTDYTNQKGCIVEFTSNEEHKAVQYPSMREDINNAEILYEMHLDTHEIVDSYMASFALSMLSRYYPDYWIGCLESHCMAAKAIEHFVYIMIKKVPMLALKLLSVSEIVISIHKAPWYR